jgi:hypothetical protein
MKSEFSVSDKTKSLFLSLTESIAQTLNVTSCYVCGGDNMKDHWPWESRELDPWVLFNENIFPNHKKNVWLLKTSIIWELLYLPHKRPVLYPSRGFNLFRTEVLQ